MGASHRQQPADKIRKTPPAQLDKTKRRFNKCEQVYHFSGRNASAAHHHRDHFAIAVIRCIFIQDMVEIRDR